MKKLFAKPLWIRIAIQIFFFIFIAVISVNHTLSETGGGVSFLSSASVHALCPFGGVESLYQFISAGSFIPKIFESSFILLAIGLILALLFGPAFCGWVCPLGSIQEWFGKIGKKIFKRRYNHFIPAKIDSVLRYTRYLMLVWVVYMTAKSLTLVFADVDPYFALFHFWVSDTSLAGIIVLIVTLLLSLLVERPWCKYACPYGAFLGIFNLFRIFSIRRKESTCKLCRVCDTRCPMNIDVSRAGKVRNHQCISCLECTSEGICPVDGTVEFVAGGK